MARWGTFPWGNGTKWGASDVTETLAYGLEIDWNGDGSFDGSSEASYMIAWSSFRGRRNMLRSTGTGFESIQTGTLTITLDNNDDRYTTRNTSSPLYPNVVPGKEIRFRVRDMSQTGTVIYPVFYGTIIDIEPQYNNVIITAEDGWRFLRTYSAGVATQEDITPDEAAGLLLDSIGWPERWGRDLDSFSDLIPYWWASGNRKAGTELEDLLNSFLGHFFVDNAGRARVSGRISVSSSAADLFQDQLLKDFRNPQPWENQYNVTRIKVHPRVVASSGTIYQMTGTAPSIQPGASLTIFADYRYNNLLVPAINVITPVATTDWLTNTQADGLGSDKTANCTLSFTDFGDTAKMKFTNNDAGTVFLIAPKIRGQAVYESSSADVTYPTDLDTVQQKRQFLLDLIWQQDINAAESFTQAFGDFLDRDNLFPVVSIENRPELQYAADLFDIVSLTIVQKGIDGLSFKVSGISHKSDPSIRTCQRVTTELLLEPYISSSDFWIWDTASEFDTKTIFGF